MSVELCHRRAGARCGDWLGEEVCDLVAGRYRARLIPRIGGTLTELWDDHAGFEILRAPQTPQAFEKRPRVYGVPVIFPPNRIRDGRFRAGGRDYVMPVNSPDGHHCHGLIGNEPWHVTEAVATDTTATVAVEYRCRPGEAFYDCFPHEFTFRNRYTLSDAGLAHEATVINIGDTPMPVGVGFHITFKVPFRSGGSAADARLRLSVGQRWEIDERTIPTERLVRLSRIEENYRALGIPPQGFPIRDHYTASHIDLDGKPFHGVCIEDVKTLDRVIYEVGAEFRHWMIWNEDGESGFICPEPMSWAIDAPNLSLDPGLTGYLELKPGATWRSTLAIRTVTKG